jgi:ubiquinone/menaquinone biosynthesis C-methylase UbiE
MVILQELAGMLRHGTRFINKEGLNYVVGLDGKPLQFKPWLGDSFSFFYDFIMRKSIFPKKFGGDMEKHHDILRKALDSVHAEQVLELATGSGSATSFVANDNRYTGMDISPGLLKKAVKKFHSAGFKEAEFYVASATDLPFEDSTFSTCLCILSLNFFDDIKKVFQEIRRVLVPDGVFVGCVPVPERNRLQSNIRGTLHSKEELAGLCKEHGLRFSGIPIENGALLYFKAVLEQ